MVVAASQCVVVTWSHLARHCVCLIIGCKLNSEKEASLIPANLSRLCLRGLFSRAATVGAAYHNPVPVALCPQVKPSKVVL